MNFGEALEALKAGKRVARTGWNCKGMFVVYQKGYPQGILCNKQTAEEFMMLQIWSIVKQFCQRNGKNRAMDKEKRYIWYYQARNGSYDAISACHSKL